MSEKKFAKRLINIPILLDDTLNDLVAQCARSENFVAYSQACKSLDRMGRATRDEFQAAKDGPSKRALVATKRAEKQRLAAAVAKARAAGFAHGLSYTQVVLRLLYWAVENMPPRELTHPEALAPSNFVRNAPAKLPKK